MNIKRLNTVLCLSAICVVSSSVAFAKDLAMTENNLQECTKLLNNVAKTDEAILKNMQARQIKAAQNSAIFAANNSAQPFPSTEKPMVQAVAIPAKPVTTETQTVTTSSLPTNTQVFASDDPRAIAHLTGKNTTPLMSTPDYVLPKSISKASSKPLKTSATKPKANKKMLHPHIELSAPHSDSTNQLSDTKKTAPVPNTDLSKSETTSDKAIKTSI